MNIVCIFMTSRSGSSMVADCFVRHGFRWARDERRNPVVGRKIVYRSFENQTVKDFLRTEFGVPLGDMVTCDEGQITRFARLVQSEYGPLVSAGNSVAWKGAVEFFYLWLAAARLLGFVFEPVVVLRREADIVSSVLAKRGAGAKGKQAEAERITRKRVALLRDIASEYAAPIVDVDEMVAGDYSSFREALQAYGYGHRFDSHIVEQVVDPNKWKADR